MLKKLLALTVVLLLPALPACADSAKLTWVHDCVDPVVAGQVTSGFGGFNIYQSDSPTGQYAHTDTVVGCALTTSVLMKHSPATSFRVTSYDLAGNESLNSNVVTKTLASDTTAPAVPSTLIVQ